MVATSFRLGSGHNSRPFASVVGAVRVGLGVVGAFLVGAGFAVVRAGAPFVDVVSGDPLGADLLGPVTGLSAAEDVETPVFAPAGAPGVVFGVAVGFGVVVTVVTGWLFTGVLATAPELAGMALDPAVIVGTGGDCAWAEDAGELAADGAGAEADSGSDASTPVNDGAADPLV